jgi:ubiquinone/menaquinone biosynthesis C-methylase UbiE
MLLLYLFMKKGDKTLEEIWNDVPPDYYQKGIRHNILQKIWHLNKLRCTLQLIQNNTNPGKILDIGCASGWFLAQIKKKYPQSKCMGIDIYDKAISYGNKLYPELQLANFDAHRLPFDNCSFDIIICTEVLEHVVSPNQVLQEIKRVLKPEGIAIIEMDTGNSLFRIVWYLWNHLRCGVWKDAHLHKFNRHKLEKLINTSGLHVVQKKLFCYNMAIVFAAKNL